MTYKASFANYEEEFVHFYKASKGLKGNSFEKDLIIFDHFCFKNYPESMTLTQEMIDCWCCKRETEKNQSFNSRISIIVRFINYVNSRHDTKYIVPQYLKSDKTHHIPYSFTNEELKKFFYACDTCKFSSTKLEDRINEYTFPVVFRLLYSSGMRTTEVRLLKVEDIDFTTGIININDSKGLDQHYVVLHDSMLPLMIQYNEKMNEILPQRKYFFSNHSRKKHETEWLRRNFKKLWNVYNTGNPVPYDFRHNYAITNINRWKNQGLEFNANLLYLSRSMGHSSVEKTKYYYALVPVIADVFKEKVSGTFDDLLEGIDL